MLLVFAVLCHSVLTVISVWHKARLFAPGNPAQVMLFTTTIKVEKHLHTKSYEPDIVALGKYVSLRICHSPSHANGCGASVEARPISLHVRAVKNAGSHKSLEKIGAPRRNIRNKESAIESITPEAELRGLGLGLDPAVGLGGLGMVRVGQLTPGGLWQVHGLGAEEGGGEGEDNGGLANHC